MKTKQIGFYCPKCKRDIICTWACPFCGYLNTKKKKGYCDMKKLLTEFFEILDEIESTDEGRDFHPVYISSCRVMKSKRIDEIFTEIKKQINYTTKD